MHTKREVAEALYHHFHPSGGLRRTTHFSNKKIKNVLIMGAACADM